jgi:hypothetical protein
MEPYYITKFSGLYFVIYLIKVGLYNSMNLDYFKLK